MLKRLKAAFGGLVDSKASESYMFWGSTAVTIACYVNAGICETLRNLHADQFVAGAIAYVAGRMVSKGAKVAVGA